jgi:hypothetical protein
MTPKETVSVEIYMIHMTPRKFKIVFTGPQLFFKENIQQKCFIGKYPHTTVLYIYTLSKKKFGNSEKTILATLASNISANNKPYEKRFWPDNQGPIWV